MRKRIKVLMVAAPLAAAVLGSGSSAAAGAVAGPAITPGNGSVVTSSTVRISVKSGIFGGQLFVNGVLRDAGKNRVLQWTLDGHAFKNGTYQVQLKDPVPLNNSTSTFKLAVPPSAPSGVQAQASGNKVTVSWNRGDEPDLLGYNVTSSLAGGKRVGMGACGGGRCSATLTVGAGASGQMAVQVVARRSGAGPSGATSRTVKLAGSSPNGNADPVPPPPNNTWPTPSNQQSANPFPSVAPGDDWSTKAPAPDATDPYRTPEDSPTVDTALLPQPVADTRTSTAAESLQWGKSIAIALVLLLCAGHLGTWTRRLRAARAGGGPAGALGPRIIPGSAHARVEANRHRIEAALVAARSATDADTDPKAKRRGLLGRRKAKATTPLELTTAEENTELSPATDASTVDHSPYLPQPDLSDAARSSSTPDAARSPYAPTAESSPAEDEPAPDQAPQPAHDELGGPLLADLARHLAETGGGSEGTDRIPGSAATSQPSSGAAPASNGAKASSNGAAPSPDGAEPTSNGAKASSNSGPSSSDGSGHGDDESRARAESGIAALLNMTGRPGEDDQAAQASDASRTEILERPRPRRFGRGRRS